MDVAARPFRLERAVAPADGSPMWVVVDADFEMQPDAAAFLAAVRGREDASVNTERAYAGASRCTCPTALTGAWTGRPRRPGSSRRS